MMSVLFPGEFGEALVKSGEGLWGERLMRLVQQYPNFAVLGEEGECLWYEDNRVTLSDERDEFGVPRPKVAFNYHDNEYRMREEIHRLGREILDAAGAEEVFSQRRKRPHDGWLRDGRRPGDFSRRPQSARLRSSEPLYL
jgi:hypothetical protein